MAAGSMILRRAEHALIYRWLRWKTRLDGVLMRPPLEEGLGELDAALVMAAFHGYFRLARRLVEHGADPASRQWHAAVQAACWQDVEAFFWLAERSPPSAQALSEAWEWTVRWNRPRGNRALAAWRAREVAAEISSVVDECDAPATRPARRL